MKLQFDSNLPYQHDAINAVVNLFCGQTPAKQTFTVSGYDAGAGKLYTPNGIGNRLALDGETRLKNLHAVQIKNALPQSSSTDFLNEGAKGDYQFTIEMETGTGKTYVYLRTILELNKQYGFSKFVIVVPTIAIKEGVYKSLQMTEEHFKNLFANVAYDYFIYDSTKIGQVRSFAVSDAIQIMVINIAAFNKSFDDKTKENKANIIHRKHDKLSGAIPIELIKETNPVVIIDEPQSVDNTDKAKEAIRSLNPLCCLRYSATHLEKRNLVYQLNAIDAFNLGLVKQIEVASLESRDAHNKPYVKLLSVDNKKSPITARIELDCRIGETIKRTKITVKKGADLAYISRRDIYKNYFVNEIWCEKDNEYLGFSYRPDVVFLGKSIGDMEDIAIKDAQIYKTIEEHLDKELYLRIKHNVKVLSLFFIDRVANYREYDEKGNAHTGRYAEIFETHYTELIARPKYKSLREHLAEHLGDTTNTHQVHDGYFSQEKKGKLKDTNGTTADDDSTYNLIMKEKEKLLDFANPLRFIFSHSALREGWDNPNVFQICTLNETGSEIKKRQEIGRGLRLCVNQHGERLHGASVNTLTVMANESYEKFVSALQKEYEKETSIRFGVLETHSFAHIPVFDEHEEITSLGYESSKIIYTYFVEQGYVDMWGRVQDILKLALVNGTFHVPVAFEAQKTVIANIAKKASSNLNIKPANNRQKIALNKERFLSPEFKDLWDRVKYKTTYSVKFDSQKLIDVCAHALQKELNIREAQLLFIKAKTTISLAGILAEETEHSAVKSNNHQEMLPDIITYLQNETCLTRKSIAAILLASDTLDLFKKNPQKYMEESSKIIRHHMRQMLVDGIKYTKIGDDAFYAQELFENEELYGYLTKNMIASTKSPYTYIVYDSLNEKHFAQKFESNNSIKCYVKLPTWFKVPTPLGTYNPDWAVLIEVHGERKLYFVIETKTDLNNLRVHESAKIQCGEKSFKALDGVIYKAVDKFDMFMETLP